MKLKQLLPAILVVAGLCGQLIAQQGDNTALSLAWHEASDAVFARGYVLTAGIDIDQDGKGEILTYDGAQRPEVRGIGDSLAVSYEGFRTVPKKLFDKITVELELHRDSVSL